MERREKMFEEGTFANGNISKPLYEEIVLKLKKIGGKPEYYDQRRTLVQENLRSLGDVYSFWIENPELRKKYLTQNKKPETLKKEAQKGIRAIHNGWYFLSEQGKYGKFIEVLDGKILESVNGIVNGGNKHSRKFRKKDVTLNILGFTPPSWEKVPFEIAKMFERAKEIYNQNPLESAIYTHLSIALIQPFDEGNKRTARLVQDRILYDAGMPPAVIPAGEGKFYLDLLCNTAIPWRDGDIKGQRKFYDYIASKVNNGLDEILDDLGV